MGNRVINVTEFKAKCLALLEEVSAGGGTITITKRGRPLATVRSAGRGRRRSPEGSWAGKVRITADPVDTTELWDVVRNPKSDL